MSAKYFLPTMLTTEWAKHLLMANLSVEKQKGLDFAFDVCAKMNKLGFPTVICRATEATSNYPIRLYLSTPDNVVLFSTRYAHGGYTLTSPYYEIKERGEAHTASSKNPRYLLNCLNKFSSEVVEEARRKQSPITGIEDMVAQAKKACFTEEVLTDYPVNADTIDRAMRVLLNNEPRGLMTANDEVSLNYLLSMTTQNNLRRERNFARLQDLFSCPKWVLNYDDNTSITTVSAVQVTVSGGEVNTEILIAPKIWEDINHFREHNDAAVATDLEVMLNMTKTSTVNKYAEKYVLSNRWGDLMTVSAYNSNALQLQLSDLQIGMFTSAFNNGSNQGVFYIVDKGV